MLKPGTPLVFIGIGNEFRGDDGAGLLVIRELRQRVDHEIPMLEHSGDAASLIDLWQGAREVVLIDAVQTGARPGTIHRWRGERVQRECFPCSTHVFGVAEAMQLANLLHCFPPSLVIYGIEAASLEWSVELSSAVKTAVRRVAMQLAELSSQSRIESTTYPGRAAPCA